jgi:hypothetical protein
MKAFPAVITAPAAGQLAARDCGADTPMMVSSARAAARMRKALKAEPGFLICVNPESVGAVPPRRPTVCLFGDFVNFR